MKKLFVKTRKSSPTQKRAKGQSLIEYALILAIVAIAVMIIVSFVGLAAQRQMGIAAAAIGHSGSASNHNGEQITITEAKCFVIAPGNPDYITFPTGVTALYVTGTTNVAAADLIVSTEKGFADNITMTGPTFVYNPQYQQSPNASLCPQAVVVQSKHGSIAEAHVAVDLGTN